MEPDRALALALVILSLVAPLAQAAPADDLRAHRYDVHEGDGYLEATRGDGPTVVAIGPDAETLVLDLAERSSSDLTVVLADDVDAAKRWAEQATPDRVVAVTGTPTGEPIHRDLTSTLLAGPATDALWTQGQARGVDLLDDGTAEPHPAGSALADAGLRPVVVDLGSGSWDPAAADQARDLLDVAADDGLAFHTAHRTLQDDDGGDGSPGDGSSDEQDDSFTLELVLEADFWLEPRWDLGPFSINLVGGVSLLGLIGGAAVMGGVKHVTPDNALDNDSRAALYDTIQDQPGIHLRELARTEDMNITSTSWHIKKLEDVGLIRSKKLEGYKVFYPSQGGKEAQRVGVAMNVLRNDNARALLGHVADHPGSYQREIADELDLNHATVRWHLDKLKQADLVTEVPLSHVTQYYVSAEGLHAIQIVEERGLNGDGDGVEAEDEAQAGEGQAS